MPRVPLTNPRIVGSVSLALLLLVGVTGAGAEEPWGLLERVRDELTRSPRQADFVQSYIPAGFSSGEQEEGRIFIALPDCVRWDYQSPYAKSFLLCEETVWTWNEGESSGRRQVLVAKEQQGLDLLRLSVESLRGRYAASVETTTGGSLEVLLSSLTPYDSLTDARFLVDADRNLLVGLSYQDLEGNLTRFEISGYDPLGDGTVFAPPAEIEWLEE
ncbi:MAG: outer membrane lipoprotein carrier protein LolA [Thermoanaerobaculia bacterium]